MKQRFEDGANVTINVDRALLNTKEACEFLGGISDKQLPEIAGEFVRRIGNSNYYAPEDLIRARDANTRHGRRP